MEIGENEIYLMKNSKIFYIISILLLFNTYRKGVDESRQLIYI